ncbi:hypothetical protein M153_3560006424 [Pseudoloma neurophilia]|uniref:Uncharacterized protein n=1 Tax=Pseudoloma neurophilia TaxID=146866 RepID=A0A0R0M3K0_9MICR|nr:hypothetical protein M153_3560006424 [Pseudoloma neurophilia]
MPKPFADFIFKIKQPSVDIPKPQKIKKTDKKNLYNFGEVVMKDVPLFQFTYKNPQFNTTNLKDSNKNNVQTYDESLKNDGFESNFFVDTMFKENSLIYYNQVNQMDQTVKRVKMDKSAPPNKKQPISRNIRNKKTAVDQNLNQNEKDLVSENLKEKNISKNFSKIKPQHLKISPIKYFMLIDKSDTLDQQLNTLFNMSIEYLNDKKLISNNDIALDIKLDKNSILEEIDTVKIENIKIKEEIDKWNEIKQENIKNTRNLKESVRQMLERISFSPDSEDKIVEKNVPTICQNQEDEIEIISPPAPASLKMSDVMDIFDDQNYEQNCNQNSEIAQSNENMVPLERHLAWLTTRSVRFLDHISISSNIIFQKVYELLKIRRIEPVLVLKKMASLKEITGN